MGLYQIGVSKDGLPIKAYFNGRIEKSKRRRNTMKKQKTFMCCSNATAWLHDLGRCFEIDKATIRKVLVKTSGLGIWGKKERWKVEVQFK